MMSESAQRIGAVLLVADIGPAVWIAGFAVLIALVAIEAFRRPGATSLTPVAGSVT